MEFRRRSTEIGAVISRNFSHPTSLFLLLALPALWLASAAAQSVAPATLPFQDERLPIAARVKDLVTRLTPDEKVSQMMNHASAVPRLGIPAYDWWNEGLHGVARAGHATVFPQAIGMAATWDTDLLQRVGDVVSTEARVKNTEALAAGNHDIYRGLTFWSPNINIFRDPRWGRGQETYGEDPYLTAQMGVAYIRGLQGSDPKYLKVIATPKHFAVHSGPEPLRHTFDARISLHDLMDTYTPAFHAAIADAKAGSIMCAYNSLLGQPACMNQLLLGKLLRSQWDFEGYVVSDCGAIGDIATGHKAAKDVPAAAAAAVRAGTDLDCGEEYRELPAAVSRGLLAESEIDRSLTRLFTARFRLGLFDRPEHVRWTALPKELNDSKEHREYALKAARESLVLLKNDREALPIPASAHRIAVIGPNADQLDVLEGNYNGTPSKYVTVLDGIRAQFNNKAVVSFAQGSLLADTLPISIPEYELHPSSVSTQPGLNAQFFDNPTFSGDAKAVRIDKHVDFDSREGQPADGIPIKGYSVRWSGSLVPDVSGMAQLGIERGQCWDCKSEDSARLYVDGKLVASDPGHRREDVVSLASVALTKGQPIALKLEYANTSGEGSMKLVWLPPAAGLREEARALAEKSDAIVMVLGISPGLEGEEMPVDLEGFKGGDRTSLDLPRPQRELFDAIAATGKPIDVVLMNGSPLALNQVGASSGAVLEAWYPGEEGGTAVAEALAGTYNPGGRLPLTFYRSVDQLPPFDDYSMARRTYRYFDGQPLYKFGYGLSYTKFVYSAMKLDGPVTRTGETLKVSVDVSNDGKVAGDEVVEVYVAAQGIPGAPLRSLAAFKRILLQPGEKQTVSFSLSPRVLSVVDAEGVRKEMPAKYSLWIGGGQPDSGAPGLAQEFSVAGEALALDN